MKTILTLALAIGLPLAATAQDNTLSLTHSSPQPVEFRAYTDYETANVNTYVALSPDGSVTVKESGKTLATLHADGRLESTDSEAALKKTLKALQRHFKQQLDALK